MIETKFDILWVLISAGLVFFMQAGFLCLESGLTRTKNSINVAIKNITDFGIATLLYYFLGFGFMFGSSLYGLIGSDSFFPNFTTNEPAIPVLFIFQLMFCGTTATIVSGAVAERMRFGAYIIVTILISSTLYPIFGHWAWGRNLSDWSVANGWLVQLGFVDFAGSTVVHSTGGWVGLVAIKIIGSRTGRFGPKSRNITGHSLPTAMLGTMILWFGWIGFNGGSTLLFSENIPKIIANTMLSAAGGLVSALIYGWRRMGYAEATLPLSGALAGLVAITAACHAVTPFESVLIGIVSGIIMYETRVLLVKFELDDAVGAIPVHLAAGIWGTLAVGIFGDPMILQTGLSYFAQIKVQIIGILACAILSFGLSGIILSLTNRFFRLRVSENKEQQGLNYSEHRATTELSDLFTEMEYQRTTGDLSQNVIVEPFTEVGQIAARYNHVLDKVRTVMQEKENVTIELERNLNKIQNDLLTAKKIQSSLISLAKQDFRKLYIYTEYAPLTEIGGDFYDIFEVKQGVYRVFLADTTGHGIKAALLTMGVKAIYDSVKKGGYDLSGVLYFLNNEYLKSFESINQFLTCIVLDIDTNKNILYYASAGHICQYLIDKGKIHKLEKTGKLIGVIKDTGYIPKQINITPHAQLFLFTDGLVEQWNSNEEEFGEVRVEKFLKSHLDLPVQDKVKQIVQFQEDFLDSSPKKDDITILGISRNLKQ
ncbi:MAG: ammonium transporter [Spirochaetota bacterium]